MELWRNRSIHPRRGARVELPRYGRNVNGRLEIIHSVVGPSACRRRSQACALPASARLNSNIAGSPLFLHGFRGPLSPFCGGGQVAYALGQGHLEGRGCACREKRRAIGVDKEERKDRCICIGGATGCETSIRLDSISPASTPVANPAPDEWQSNRDSRFVSRFCMTVDQGPVQATSKWHTLRRSPE